MNLKEEINNILPNDLKIKLKEMLVKFEDSVITEKPKEVEETKPEETKMMVEVKSKDGLVFTAENLEVGTEIKQITSYGIVDVIDGMYELETGEMLTVTGGKITEFKPMEVAEVIAPELGEVKTDLETLKSTVASLNEMVAKMTSQLNEQNKTIGVTLSAINTIIEQPASKPIEKPNGLFSHKNKQFENIAKLKK